MKVNKIAQDLINLIEHIITMGDDSYLMGHPEWNEIVKEAKEIKEGQQ